MNGVGELVGRPWLRVQDSGLHRQPTRQISHDGRPPSPSATTATTQSSARSAVAISSVFTSCTRHPGGAPRVLVAFAERDLCGRSPRRALGSWPSRENAGRAVPAGWRRQRRSAESPSSSGIERPVSSSVIPDGSAMVSPRRISARASPVARRASVPLPCLPHHGAVPGADIVDAQAAVRHRQSHVGSADRVGALPVCKSRRQPDPARAVGSPDRDQSWSSSISTRNCSVRHRGTRSAGPLTGSRRRRPRYREPRSWGRRTGRSGRRSAGARGADLARGSASKAATALASEVVRPSPCARCCRARVAEP